MRRRAGEPPALASTFAVGEEAEQSGPVTIREVGKIAAPDRCSRRSLQPGSTVRVDAVVRTRKIGHFFPGGTVDALDVWLEFKARDANGRVLAWSGSVADKGRGPVDPGAHFYRSYLLDAEGNPINKRNAWQARSVFYVRLIPPGAADTVHYLVDIPRDARGPVRLEARLNYRKFTDYYTRFSFANARRRCPVLPIVTMRPRRHLRAAGRAALAACDPLAGSRALERLGHRPAAAGRSERRRIRFQRVTRGRAGLSRRLGERGAGADPGRRNRSRAAVPGKRRWRSRRNWPARNFSWRWCRRPAAITTARCDNLDDVRRQYPRDRVVIDQVGRILFLKRRYADAVRRSRKRSPSIPKTCRRTTT